MSKMQSAYDVLAPVFCNEIVCQIPFQCVRHLFYRLVRMRIGKKSVIMGHTEVIAPNRIQIGDHSIIGRHCLLDGRGELIIGSNVNVSSYTLLVAGSHDYNDPAFAATYKPIVIEDYAWIGTRAMILQGVTVGKGALVAAGSVVTRNVEPFAIVAGAPAKQIGERNRDPRYTLNLFQPMW